MQAIIDKLTDEKVVLENRIEDEQLRAKTLREQAAVADSAAEGAEEELTAVEAAIAVLGGKQKRRRVGLRKK